MDAHNTDQLANVRARNDERLQGWGFCLRWVDIDQSRIEDSNIESKAWSLNLTAALRQYIPVDDSSSNTLGCNTLFGRNDQCPNGHGSGGPVVLLTNEVKNLEYSDFSNR